MFGKAIVRGFVAVAIVSCAVVAQAVNIELVPVGNPGNVGEWSGESYDGDGPDRLCGAVDYNYQIGKYEVTFGQYTEFLNAAAAVTDPHELYGTFERDEIERTPVSGGYSYSVVSGYANRPVDYVSYWDAARFANWMHNGQGGGDIDTGAYTLGDYNGDDGRTITRNSGAQWFLPSEDEWYKAAYHKNNGVTGDYFDYPTGVDIPNDPGWDISETTNPGNNANYGWNLSSTTPVGEFYLSDSPYGTFDQGGNVWEWNEEIFLNDDESILSRGTRGSSFYDSSAYMQASDRSYTLDPTRKNSSTGFRLASVPEPGSLAMLAGIALTAMLYYWRKRV